MLPASRDPVSDAEHRERAACPRSAPRYPPDLFSPSSVISVEPVYFTRSERGDQQAHLIGATIALRPIPDVSSEELERLLNCHAARSQLHRAGEPAVPDDPYWVPGQVVHLTVELDEGDTRVKIEGNDFTAGKEILARARAFAAAAAKN